MTTGLSLWLWYIASILCGCVTVKEQWKQSTPLGAAPTSSSIHPQKQELLPLFRKCLLERNKSFFIFRKMA